VVCARLVAPPTTLQRRPSKLLGVCLLYQGCAYPASGCSFMRPRAFSRSPDPSASGGYDPPQDRAVIIGTSFGKSVSGRTAGHGAVVGAGLAPGNGEGYSRSGAVGVSVGVAVGVSVGGAVGNGVGVGVGRGVGDGVGVTVGNGVGVAGSTVIGVGEGDAVGCAVGWAGTSGAQATTSRANSPMTGRYGNTAERPPSDSGSSQQEDAETAVALPRCCGGMVSQPGSALLLLHRHQPLPKGVDCGLGPVCQMQLREDI
jgi:hypothetical protein